MKGKEHINYDREALAYEAKILNKLSAFEIMNELGIEEACVMYPEEKTFLEKAQNKDYFEVRRTLLTKLTTSLDF